MLHIYARPLLLIEKKENRHDEKEKRWERDPAHSTEVFPFQKGNPSKKHEWNGESPLAKTVVQVSKKR
jgi:hypothetical protein